MISLDADLLRLPAFFSRLQPTPRLPPASAGGTRVHIIVIDSRLLACFSAWFQPSRGTPSEDSTRSPAEAGLRKRVAGAHCPPVETGGRRGVGWKPTEATIVWSIRERQRAPENSRQSLVAARSEAEPRNENARE